MQPAQPYPDMVLGRWGAAWSEGAFGVITSITLDVRPAPAPRLYDGWRFESFATGATAIRRLVQDGPVPTVLRLSDEAETALNLAPHRDRTLHRGWMPGDRRI